MTTPIADIPASSTPDARTWIFEGIGAQLAGAENVLVCLDEAGTYQPDDIVIVGDVHQTYSPEQTVGSGGRFWLREDFTVTVTVSVYRGGDDPAGVFARARQLADMVVAVVRSDPSLGGAVDRAMPTSAVQTGGWADEDGSGRESTIELEIGCMNTI
ncbi:hypothetical protein ACEZCY_14715 [Streptacidiphilus sp. N1-12]|uniref:Uncharacterized protein n=2 Tax=Streptacidiphilus alkalitolerans TaxID=3342712 RepID=A0ABV6V9W1_9ACTN